MPRTTPYLARQSHDQTVSSGLKLRGAFRSWWRGLRRRMALARLVEEHPRLVADIGLTVTDAEAAARTNFWKSKALPTLRPW
jgi:uncharacterized protein YjiS (DUF1127 family)